MSTFQALKDLIKCPDLKSAIGVLNGLFLEHLKTMFYNTFTKPILIKKLRKKDKIKVLFVLHELGSWKTEQLYVEMLKHPSFDAILLVTEKKDVAGHHNKTELENYLNIKGYSYIELNENETIKSKIYPDIIFYQKPYAAEYNKEEWYLSNLYCLFCYVPYGFNPINEVWNMNQSFQNDCWQFYFENELSRYASAKLMDNKGKNCIVTGLPMTDEYLESLDTFRDVWKNQPDKKRIIWAPHHSLPESGYMNNSTFLEYYDFMIKMAEKYKDEVQFVFKPHPLLHDKLLKFWTKTKIDEYYNRWAIMENTQFMDGRYVDLFMTSDAMIHDCGSFTVEYHYTKKPVMFLLKDDNLGNNLPELGRKALDLHYKGRTEKDIEQFINDVIDDKDPMKEQREQFYKDYLLPPHGKTACENIMNSILGLA